MRRGRMNVEVAIPPSGPRPVNRVVRHFPTSLLDDDFLYFTERYCIIRSVILFGGPCGPVGSDRLGLPQPLIISVSRLRL